MVDQKPSCLDATGCHEATAATHSLIKKPLKTCGNSPAIVAFLSRVQSSFRLDPCCPKRQSILVSAQRSAVGFGDCFVLKEIANYSAWKVVGANCLASLHLELNLSSLPSETAREGADHQLLQSEEDEPLSCLIDACRQSLLGVRVGCLRP